jgi:hypothetical protein
LYPGQIAKVRIGKRISGARKRIFFGFFGLEIEEEANDMVRKTLEGKEWLDVGKIIGNIF